MHKRSEIREAVKSVLVSGVSDVSGRVFTNRTVPGFRGEYPRIHIWTLDETSVDAFVSTTESQRILNLIVDVRVRAGIDDTDDKLDQIAEKVEIAMKQDHTLSGLANISKLVRTEMELSSEGDQVIGMMGLNFEVNYTF